MGQLFLHKSHHNSRSQNGLFGSLPWQVQGNSTYTEKNGMHDAPSCSLCLLDNASPAPDNSYLDNTPWDNFSPGHFPACTSPTHMISSGQLKGLYCSITPNIFWSMIISLNAVGDCILMDMNWNNRFTLVGQWWPVFVSWYSQLSSHTPVQYCIDVVLINLNSVEATVTLCGNCTWQVFLF